MASSKRSKRLLFDEVRQSWIAATPEEIVRQKLLQGMIHSLGYPKELIAIEKELSQMPHLSSVISTLPNRRADLICFGKGIHPDYPVYPLLLIECKKEQIDQKSLDQVRGYNHHIQAYFIGVAAPERFTLVFRNTLIPFLPAYKDLIDALSKQ